MRSHIHQHTQLYKHSMTRRKMHQRSLWNEKREITSEIVCRHFFLSLYFKWYLASVFLVITNLPLCEGGVREFSVHTTHINWECVFFFWKCWMCNEAKSNASASFRRFVLFHRISIFLLCLYPKRFLTKQKKNTLSCRVKKCEKNTSCHQLAPTMSLK